MKKEILLILNLNEKNNNKYIKHIKNYEFNINEINKLLTYLSIFKYNINIKYDKNKNNYDIILKIRKIFKNNNSYIILKNLNENEFKYLYKYIS